MVVSVLALLSVVVPLSRVCLSLRLTQMYTQGITSPELLASLTDAQVDHYGSLLATTPEARVIWGQRCAAARAEPTPPALLLPDQAVQAFRDSFGSNWEDRVRAAYLACRPWTHLEYLCGSGPVSAFQLSLALEWVFMERTRVDEREALELSYPNLVRAFTFEHRCELALMPHLLAVRSLDETSGSTLPRFSAGPRERILWSSAPPVSRDPRGLRWPAHLIQEASVRLQLSSVAASWKSLSSALRTWDTFMTRTAPRAPHFPVDSNLLAMYAQVFQNADAFSKYVTHLRTGSRLLGVRPPSRELASALARGLKRWHVPRPRASISGHQLLDIIRWCLDSSLVDLARLLVVARQLLLRVESELFPLQLDGRVGLLPQDVSWHSQIVLRPVSVSLLFRRRKADPRGARLTRQRICDTQGRLLCGVCSLRAQISSHCALGFTPSRPLFGALAPPASLTLLQQAAAALAQPRPTWHSLRRGMAGDLLRSGATLAQVLAAGGWKSGSFFRYLRRRDVDARVDAELHLPSDDSE